MALLVKAGNGLAFASIKSVKGLLVASMKAWRGLDTTAPVGGGITLIDSSNGQNGAHDATSGAINSTGANLLIVGVSNYGGAPGYPTDSKGNTWSLATNHYASGAQGAQFFYSKPTSVGSGHTAFVSAGTQFPVISFAAFSGTNAVPLEGASGTVGGAGGNTQPGVITPLVPNCLFLSLMSSLDTVIPTVGSGFSIIEFLAYAVGQNMGGALAYMVQAGGPSAVNPTWNSAATKTCIMAAFRP